MVVSSVFWIFLSVFTASGANETIISRHVCFLAFLNFVFVRGVGGYQPSTIEE